MTPEEIDKVVYDRVIKAHIDALWMKCLIGDDDSKPVGVIQGKIDELTKQ